MRKETLDVINAFSGLATVSTLVYLIIKDVITRKDINHLSKIVQQLQKQNDLYNLELKTKAEPELLVEKVEFIAKNEKRYICLHCINRGSDTIVVGSKFDKELGIDWFLSTAFEAIKIRPNEAIKVYGLLTIDHLDIKHYKFNLDIYHRDVYYNSYVTNVHGIHGNYIKVTTNDSNNLSSY